jgi:protocatechuate 3,4-dioxygenase beta subunit
VRLNRILLFLVPLLWAVAPVSAADNCVPTNPDGLGPFFVSGMPVTTSLVRSDRSGEPMVVLGKVLNAANPSQPVAAARLEAWQTDDEGHYFPENNGPSSFYKDDELDLRGTLVTDQNGNYRYDSLVPGAYFPRPKHIHYVITAPGYKQLVTQHYLGEPGRLPQVPCRSGTIDRSTGRATFNAPAIYLEPIQ